MLLIVELIFSSCGIQQETPHTRTVRAAQAIKQSSISVCGALRQASGHVGPQQQSQVGNGFGLDQNW